MSMQLSLIILAGGLGTRFGGAKQLAPLGPAGEAVLDYTLHDAAPAGFSHAVIVVAPTMLDAMAAHFDQFVPPIAVELAVQTVDEPNRSRPWGTAHATLAGAANITTPFAVANADDAYGAAAIAALADHLRSFESESTKARGAVVGYSAAATLSEHGGVSRGVCRVDGGGRLVAIEEHTGVRHDGTAIVSDTAQLAADTPISMNLWGFDSGFLARLRPTVAEFLASAPPDDRELRLPDVVGALVERGDVEISVLPTDSPWFGVTYPEDAPAVRERFAALGSVGANLPPPAR